VQRVGDVLTRVDSQVHRAWKGVRNVDVPLERRIVVIGYLSLLGIPLRYAAPLQVAG